MVIHHFNKLIRNKWVWGAFAIVISAAFCFDGLFTSSDRDEASGAEAGKLAGKSVRLGLFTDVVEDIRGFGQNRDWHRKTGEVNQMAWEIVAALSVAGKDGFEATDIEVREWIRRDPSFSANGQFSFAKYQALLRENSLTPERYEAFLKRRLTMLRLGEAVLSSAAWASPMEVDRTVADLTDTYTVRVARFSQSTEDADKVTIDDAAIRKWYDENTNSLELPERIKIRMVKFDATQPTILAKMVVTDDELHDHYDATVDRYTTTDTNGVESVKKFEDVKDQVEKEVRRIAAVQYFETNLNRLAYAVKSQKGASRLDEIAADRGLKVETSDWFSLEGGAIEGFSKSINSIAPGVEGFAAAVAELDSTSEDLRYGIVSSDRAVWLIEKAETSPKHTPSFDEAKEAIRPRVLRDAKADAFKASIEAIAAKGTNAVLSTTVVSTNITFAICDLQAGDFADQNAVADVVRKLNKGEISSFKRTGMNTGLLVVCLDRVEGDAAKVLLYKDQIASDLATLQRRQLPESWQKWNLESLGFESNETSSVVDNTEEVE
jgi:hypothetical protein